MTAARGPLGSLEEEAIYVLREVVAERAKCALLFSAGKDSIVLVRLAQKAFLPARIPFPLLHVDTGHNFPEVMAFRDQLVARTGVSLLVGSVEDAIREGLVQEETGVRASRNRLQTTALLTAIAAHGIEAAFGGARRDEERARAKERVISVRDDLGQWDPRNQRPELWDLYNTQIPRGGHLRAFPLSNWTELDVWEYIRAEALDVPAIYFSHPREVFARDGMLYANSPLVRRLPTETPFMEAVRFRTVGDMTCTGAVRSTASTLDEVLVEVAGATLSERGATRADDRATEAAMEDRKREGYF